MTFKKRHCAGAWKLPNTKGLREVAQDRALNHEPNPIFPGVDIDRVNLQAAQSAAGTAARTNAPPPYPADRGQTHWDGCELSGRSHYGCLLAKYEALRSEIGRKGSKVLPSQTHARAAQCQRAPAAAGRWGKNP
jgi:hypothetical protein